MKFRVTAKCSGMTRERVIEANSAGEEAYDAGWRCRVYDEKTALFFNQALTCKGEPDDVDAHLLDAWRRGHAAASEYEEG